MKRHNEHTAGNGPGLRDVILWVFLGIILFFLLTEHRAHVFGVLPYLLLLACPLMHLFMHGGHGGHGHRRRGEEAADRVHRHDGPDEGNGRNGPEDRQ